MKFINPYNFVKEPPLRRGFQAGGLDRLRGYSGVLSCVLATVTPTVVVGEGKRREIGQATDPSGNPVILGPALKGMIRNVFEVLSGSCNAASINENERCTDPMDCCRACRVFGMVAGDHHYGGFIRFSDAKGKIHDIEEVNFCLPREGAPRPTHRPFYYLRRKGQSYPRGRKFYYHYECQPASWPPTGAKLVSRIKANSKLSFQVSFEGLDDDDLCILVYSLMLEAGLGHKIGHGRPLGLGSCTISLTPVKSLLSGHKDNPGAGFQRFDGVEFQLGKNRLEKIVDQAKAFLEAQLTMQPTLEDLRIMLRLPSYHPEHYQALPVLYPTNAWFWYDRHSVTKVPLPTVQEVERGEGMLDDSPVGRVLVLGTGSKPYRRQEPVVADSKGVTLHLPHGIYCFKKGEMDKANGEGDIDDLISFMKSRILEIRIEAIHRLQLTLEGIRPI